jgi:hypothetical protein
MIRTCENPTCGKEVKGPTNKRYCGKVCRMRVNYLQDNKRRSAKKANAEVQLMEWKQRYIQNNHAVYCVEHIAYWIKKTVLVVKEYCNDNGLGYFSDPSFTPDSLKRPGRVAKTATELPKEYKRPEPEYTNRHPVYGYANYKCLLCR